MQNKLSFSILVLFVSSYSFRGFSQNIEIQVCPLEHHNLIKSLICLSSSDGQTNFEHILSNDEIINGSLYSIPYHGKVNILTILNEYIVDSLNEGRPFIKAMSYYDIGSKIDVLKFNHPQMRPFYEDRFVLLSIINCPPIEKFIFYTDASALSHWKLNKDKIWAQAFFEPGEDVFIVLKPKNNSSLRYIYLDSDDIKPLNPGQVTANDAITLDWSHLPTDLRQIDLSLPLDVLHEGSIQITNNKTNNYCTLFSKRNIHYTSNPKVSSRSEPIYALPDSAENLSLFIPSRLSFYDLRSNLTFLTPNPLFITYRYSNIHGTDIALPYFPPEVFQFEDLKIDTFVFTVRLGQLPDFFKIDYTKGTGAIFGAGIKLHHFRDSHWQILGENRGLIQFTLPKLSPQIISEFPSLKSDLGNWYLRGFEMIKVLEDDEKIDWINFLGDYNLLYIKPSLK